MHTTYDQNRPSGRDTPFPWLCIECGQEKIYPRATDYTITVKHDGRPYTIRVPDLEIPTCRNCGEQVFGIRDDERIWEALRAQAGLLTPQEIRARRAQLGLSQGELADRLGVEGETLSRWEEGGVIQPLAMDNLLRIYLESEEARAILRRRRVKAQPLAV